MERKKQKIRHFWSDQMLPKRREGASFFKVLIGDFSTQLRIPQTFIKLLNDDVPKECFLCCPGRPFYHIGLEKVENEWYFKTGWRVFVKDNSLVSGEFLVFSYDGKLKFEVEMYGINGCQNKVSVLTENQPMVKTTSEECVTRKRGRKPMPQSEKERRRNASATREASNLNSVFVSRITRSRSIGINVSAGLMKERAQVGDVNRANQSIETDVIDIDSDSCSDHDEAKRRHYSVNRRITRQSAAHKGTMNEKYPCFNVVMRPTHIVGGFMSLPVWFTRIYIKNHNKKEVTLEFKSRSWLVDLNFYGEFVRLGAGWVLFVRDNSVCEGDTCSFHLVEASNIVLKVSIQKMNRSK